jgi:hypothetical protein
MTDIYNENKNQDTKVDKAEVSVKTIFIDLDDQSKTLSFHIMTIRETLSTMISDHPLYLYFIKGEQGKVRFNISFLFDFIQSIENHTIVPLIRGYVEHDFLMSVRQKKLNFLYSSKCLYVIPGYSGEMSDKVSEEFPGVVVDFF